MFDLNFQINRGDYLKNEEGSRHFITVKNVQQCCNTKEGKENNTK